MIPVEYVFQELDDLPKRIYKTIRKNKALGTGHAILACKRAVTDPFLVINADDYYGKTHLNKSMIILSRNLGWILSIHFVWLVLY